MSQVSPQAAPRSTARGLPGPKAANALGSMEVWRSYPSSSEPDSVRVEKIRQKKRSAWSDLTGSQIARVEIERIVALIRAGLAALVVGLSTMLPASAQLMLPGAVRKLPPEGASNAPQGSAAPMGADAGQAKSKPVRLPAPSEATIVGRDLLRDGSMGSMTFRRGAANGLEIWSLSLAGEGVSNRGVPCQVDVVAGAPIGTRLTGRLGGLARYEVDIVACPFSFEVLDGAVLVTRDPKTCTFEAADCRVDPTGLWGPRGDSIDERQIKQWERARAQAEANMRENFRALLASAGKDKEAVKRIAGEQAGFSSERSVTCSTYAGEDQHGLCALRLTEARAIGLQARRQAAAKEKPDQATARSSAVRKNTAP
jgi:hypothetical protein